MFLSKKNIKLPFKAGSRKHWIHLQHVCNMHYNIDQCRPSGPSYISYFSVISSVSSYTSRTTVQCTRMAPHTRLLSNNNDSDLLEISGRCPTSGKDDSEQPTCVASVFTSAHTLSSHTCSGHTHLHTTAWKGIKHFFFLPLRKTRGVNISLLALNVVPCHHPPFTWEQFIGIQLHRYLRKQSLLNILTAVCSVSRGHVQYTGVLGIDKENCKFVLPATCAL